MAILSILLPFHDIHIHQIVRNTTLSSGGLQQIQRGGNEEPGGEQPADDQNHLREDHSTVRDDVLASLHHAGRADASGQNRGLENAAGS